MKTIWKYVLEPDVDIKMPAGAEILTIQAQNNTPCMWVLVDPDLPRVQRRFRSYGTGHNVPDDAGQYLGTFQFNEGGLVFHVFQDER